ncbi:MAG TPA: hypothetical protein VGS79_05205 [Puia sp.]|nr:hypothetical protein [Puia sp.]
MKIEWIFEETTTLPDIGRHPFHQNKMSRYFSAIPELIRAAGKIITIGGSDLTLVSDIEGLIDRIETARPIVISLDAKKFSERGLSKKMKLNVYRVIQEQLGNIAKFSRATETNISLHTAGRKIILDIRDNGKPPDLSQRNNGICITDVLACAEMNNGRAILDSKPGIGSLLHVEFSFHPAETRTPTHRYRQVQFN